MLLAVHRHVAQHGNPDAFRRGRLHCTDRWKTKQYKVSAFLE